MSERRRARRPQRPWLPPGRYVWLPGRGRTFVRELAGPPGAPVLVLLHGWTATADLNWFACFAPLAEHFRVIALDHRGHGRGLRSAEPFRLEHCADDVAALARELGIDRFVPVGYSMGGPIAQLIWQRHRELVDGLVLCATSATFTGTVRERLLFGVAAGTSVVAGAVPIGQADERRARPGGTTGATGGAAVVGVRRGRPPRLGRRSSRPGGRSAASTRGAGSARSPCRRRSSSPTTTTSCRVHRQLALADAAAATRRSGGSPAGTPCAPRRPSGSCRRWSTPARRSPPARRRRWSLAA